MEREVISVRDHEPDYGNRAKKVLYIHLCDVGFFACSIDNDWVACLLLLVWLLATDDEYHNSKVVYICDS